MHAPMNAAIRTRYGSVDHVRVVELERPVPAEGEVLVRVHTASVNRADLDYIAPRPQFIRAFVGIRRPRNPRLGTDVGAGCRGRNPPSRGG